MTPDETNSLNQIKTTIAVLEHDVGQMVGNRKILMGMFFALVIQAISVIYGYGVLNNKVEGIDTADLRTNISTSLFVAGQHGDELKAVRAEQSRIQGLMDYNGQVHDTLRNKIDARTNDRYYRADGDKIEARVLRLENAAFKHDDYTTRNK